MEYFVPSIPRSYADIMFLVCPVNINSQAVDISSETLTTPNNISMQL